MGGVLTHNLYLQLKIGPKFLVDEKSSKIELYRLIMIFFLIISGLLIKQVESNPQKPIKNK